MRSSCFFGCPALRRLVTLAMSFVMLSPCRCVARMFLLPAAAGGVSGFFGSVVFWEFWAFSFLTSEKDLTDCLSTKAFFKLVPIVPQRALVDFFRVFALFASSPDSPSLSSETEALEALESWELGRPEAPAARDSTSFCELLGEATLSSENDDLLPKMWDVISEASSSLFLLCMKMVPSFWSRSCCLSAIIARARLIASPLSLESSSLSDESLSEDDDEAWSELALRPFPFPPPFPSLRPGRPLPELRVSAADAPLRWLRGLFAIASASMSRSIASEPDFTKIMFSTDSPCRTTISLPCKLLSFRQFAMAMMSWLVT
mmetsp:Transcript_105329/g.187228  ORF Transcript_105329/g.187228 Transcript_105329/m.187228 type:complete len:317 (-) Transcript_105329:717-1667(-)